MSIPANHDKSWTKDQVSQLKILALGNTPTRVIALKMGRTEEAIYAKAADVGITLKPTNQSPYGRQG